MTACGCRSATQQPSNPTLATLLRRPGSRAANHFTAAGRLVDISRTELTTFPEGPTCFLRLRFLMLALELALVMFHPGGVLSGVSVLSVLVVLPVLCPIFGLFLHWNEECPTRSAASMLAHTSPEQSNHYQCKTEAIWSPCKRQQQMSKNGTVLGGHLRVNPRPEHAPSYDENIFAILFLCSCGRLYERAIL